MATKHKQQLSDLRQAWRRAVAAIDGAEGTEREDENLDKLLDRAKAIADKIWATPAHTFSDVLLRAEIADYHGGATDFLNETGPYVDLEARAAQQLVKAVMDVLGPLSGQENVAGRHSLAKPSAVGRRRFRQRSADPNSRNAAFA